MGWVKQVVHRFAPKTLSVDWVGSRHAARLYVALGRNSRVHHVSAAHRVLLQSRTFDRGAGISVENYVDVGIAD